MENSRAYPIYVKFPFILDEEIAKVAAMIMDGSLSKDIKKCMFCQKKDTGKIIECREIILRKLGIIGCLNVREDTTHVVTYPTVFTSFLFYCLDIHCSSQSARIPSWIWKSPISVIREYVRYAFAMEGSVDDPTTGKTTIRFHTTDLPYVEQLRELLQDKFSIKSYIYKYYVKDYGWKYYLWFSSKDSIKKFHRDLGFALLSHQNRLDKLASRFKASSADMTLVSLESIEKEIFRLSDVQILFPDLCKRAVHHRLTDLVRNNYLTNDKKSGYSLTKFGKAKQDTLRDHTIVENCRTQPKANETIIKQAIDLRGELNPAEIARLCKLNIVTVRDVLKRLFIKGEITKKRYDKFGRKFYKVLNQLYDNNDVLILPIELCL